MNGNRILVNVMEKKRGKSEIANEEYHITRNYGKAPATGSQIAELRQHNACIVRSVKNYNKYIKKHGHVGYKAYSEITDFKTDFVIPRLTAETIKVDTLTVCPGFRINPTEEAIKQFKESADFLYFDDYIRMLEQDEKFKDCIILNAVVHFDEVHFPKAEYDENGEWVRDYSMEESAQKAYIPVHMHIDYIPLTRAKTKDGTEYLKLNHNGIWNGSGCKYWQTYKEFNDKCYDRLGKIYDVERGEAWLDWKDRINSGDESVKKQCKLNEYKLKQEEARLRGKLKKAKSEYMEAVEGMRTECRKEQKRLDALKKMLLIEQEKTKNAVKEMRRKADAMQQQIDVAEKSTKLFYDIERMLAIHQISKESALKAIIENGMEEDLVAFSFDDSEKDMPNLYELSKEIKEDR